MVQRIAREPAKRRPGTALQPTRAQPEARAEPQPTPGRPKSRQPGAAVSDAARLAAEVARLEGELDTLRGRLRDLEASAECDPLTEVLNRRGFERELARAIAYLGRYDSRAVLIYLDLDDFKPVNDRHGHAAGDAVLKAVAATLTRHLRASDSVARLGGDEFAALLWNLSDENAASKALALEADLAATSIPWSGITLSAAASAGIAALSANDTPAGVIARADAAMYARKAARKR
jgi:diguanylate cyclase (GGDEF)-like protein